MSGIRCNIKDLGQSFNKWKAMNGEEARREARIKELMQPYLNNDESEKEARAHAEADHAKIHQQNKQS